MAGPIKKLIFQELHNNEFVKLQDLYKIVIEQVKDPTKTETELRHRVRSVLDELSRNDKIIRVAPSTYKKTDEFA